MHILAGSFVVLALIIGLIVILSMLRSHGNRMVHALAGQSGLPQTSATVVDLRAYRVRNQISKAAGTEPLKLEPLSLAA